MEGGESHAFEKEGINSLRMDGAIEWDSRKERMSLDAPISSSSCDFSLDKSLSCNLNLMERETVEAEETDANMMDGELRSRFKRICVFCGSSSGNRTVFSDSALALGHELVKRRIDLVYGGGSAGLMGLVSRTVYDGGCHVLGVIPTALLPIEISGQTVGEVKTVSDMHERKAEMARRSDAFIALPGGYGTMEELLEMIAWSQLGIHSKPVGLLNVDGYYNSLLALFDNGVEEGFIHPTARHIVISARTAEELLVKLEQYTPLHEQVAPCTNWEFARLGFSMPLSPP